MIARHERLLRAFADQTRLRILNLLSIRKELCVCDLIAALGMGQSKVSRHLSTLKQSGLIIDRKQGRWSYYSHSKPRNELHRRLLSCLRECFDDAKTFKRDGARLNARARRCR